MKRSLRSVDSTGDTVTFASELSTSFFTALQEACQSFSALFEEHYTKPKILNLLLNWVQKQVASYVEILIPHVSSLHVYYPVCRRPFIPFFTISVADQIICDACCPGLIAACLLVVWLQR
jgi:hypothetical protein